jgi:copper chaperone CopZ
VRVSLKSVAGVESVDVSLEKGIATVKMKPANTATLKQLQDAITKNGFTVKQSNIVIAGAVLVSDGKAQLQVSGSNDVLLLIPDSQNVPNAAAMQGKSLVIAGTVPEAAKGKSPDSLRYRSITEGPRK